YLARERAVLPLGRVTDPVTAPAAHLGGEPVAVALGLVQEPAVVQRVEESKAHPLAEAGAVHDVAQPERLAGMLERPQDLGRVKERLHEIQLAPAPPAFRRGVHAFYIAQPATCGRRSAEPGDAPTNPWNRSPLTEVAGVLLSFASRTETCRSN